MKRYLLIPLLIPLMFGGIAHAQCGSLVINPFTGKLDCVGSGGGGTVTIANGGTNATSAAAGTIPNANSGIASSWTATPTLGASGTLGSVTMGNATSGTLTLEPATGALGTV